MAIIFCHWSTPLVRSNYPSIINRISFIYHAKYRRCVRPGALVIIITEKIQSITGMQ